MEKISRKERKRLAKREKVLLKNKIELKKWQNYKAPKIPFLYFFYLMVILCMAYVISGIAQNFSSAMQNQVLDTFFGGQEGLSKYTIVLTLCTGISILTFFYRAKADRYGRKPILVINLIGIGIGMFVCFIANKSLPVYIVGLVLIFFFSPCDIQSLYVIEMSSEKYRAFNLALTKAIGTLGVVLIPIVRKYLPGNWQYIFIVPAIMGIIGGISGIFLCKESKTFVEYRIAYLRKDIRQGYKPPKKKSNSSQGGVLSAIKYMINHEELLWLFLACLLFAISSIGQANYAIVMQPDEQTVNSLASYSINSLNDDEVIEALIVYPFFAAAIILINGIVSDKCGRKKATIFACSAGFLSIIFFVAGIRSGWWPHIIGAFLGGFLGSYFAANDTFNVMCSEVAPTNLRSSVMSVLSVSLSIGSFISTLILLLLGKISKNIDIAIIIIIVVAISLAGALALLILKIPETSGRIINKMTGIEEDNSKTKKEKNA